MKLYVKYSLDPPYLPEAEAESAGELARMLGKDLNVIRSSFSHHLSGYEIVEVDSLEEDD